MNKACDVVGVEIKKGSSLDPLEKQRAIESLELWVQPLGVVTTIDLLTELRLTTTSKKLSPQDLEAQVKIYARKLNSYPAEIVKYVLETQPNMSRWFPEWLDLKTRLDLYSKKNRSALDALKNYKPETTEKSEKPVTQDQMKEILARIAKSNSVRPK